MKTNLPLIRSHERMDYKRCPKKWYWKWRKGLTPKVVSFGPLELGTWMHLALAAWYADRESVLYMQFNIYADMAIALAKANGAPDHVIEKAEELSVLGEAMCIAYEKHYGSDPNVHVIGSEIPLEFSISDDAGNTIALHMLKPDLVYRDESDAIWLMEHKTAASIRTSHLVIDDQARPYGVMAERALKNAGVIEPRESVKGIMYNFLRKALPDERPTDREGKYLNKNGSVSAKQPPPYFLRQPVLLTRKAKLVSLRRIQVETSLVAAITNGLKDKTIDPNLIPKTPHNSCPRFCQFFAICVAEEEGTDIRDMTKAMFTVQNPYDYGETTDEHVGFEMG